MLGTSTNLCKRDVLQGPVLLGEHFFACFINSEHIAGLVQKLVSHPVKEWKIRRDLDVSGPSDAHILEIFSHTQSNPNGCRRIHGDQIRKQSHQDYNNICINGADGHLIIPFVECVQNMYCDSHAGFIMVTSLLI